MKTELRVNGEVVTLEGEPMARLLDVLREQMGLTGTKEGCGEGECGACTVLMDGEPILSCLTPLFQCQGSERRHHRRDRRQPGKGLHRGLRGHRWRPMRGLHTGSHHFCLGSAASATTTRQEKKSRKPWPAISVAVPVTKGIHRAFEQRKQTEDTS